MGLRLRITEYLRRVLPVVLARWLATLLAAACLDGMGLVAIPSWAALCGAALGCFVVYRNVVGLGLYDDGPADDPSDVPDEDDPN